MPPLSQGSHVPGAPQVGRPGGGRVTYTMAASHPHPAGAELRPTSPYGLLEATISTTVRAAGESGTPEAASAVETLCGAYCYPTYAPLRHRGYPHADAEDLNQEFFARLISHYSLKAAAPEGGRFRSILLACLNHLLINDWDKSQALKRGGGTVSIPWDEIGNRERYVAESTSSASPELVYERAWATTLVRGVQDGLRHKFARKR